MFIYILVYIFIYIFIYKSFRILVYVRINIHLYIYLYIHIYIYNYSYINLYFTTSILGASCTTLYSYLSYVAPSLLTRTLSRDLWQVVFAKHRRAPLLAESCFVKPRRAQR